LLLRFDSGALTGPYNPALQDEDIALLRAFPPRTLPQLAAQRDVLKRYAAAAPCAVLAGYCAAYVLMQTFAIPGTIMLSLLAGGLYGAWKGAALVAVVSTAGSCSCYCLSWAVGQPLARALWPERVDKFAAEVGRRRLQLLNYIVFLRVTPILPNTFINVASPIVGVPLAPFALGEPRSGGSARCACAAPPRARHCCRLCCSRGSRGAPLLPLIAHRWGWPSLAGTLLGCLPNNFVAVNAGSHLGDLTSLTDLYSGRLLALGAAVGAVALAPMLLKQRHAAQAGATAAAGKLA
jgi:uncharacterized membrane protein YdjX (TVP38/TMEM64 family)